MSISVTMDLSSAIAARAALYTRLEAVRDSLKILAPTSRLTLAEFEAMPSSDWPSDLRTVLIEQLSNAIAAFDKAIGLIVGPRA